MEKIICINFLVSHTLQNSLFCAQQKKEIHTGLEPLERFLFFMWSL